VTLGLLGLDAPGHLDGPAEEQKLLGEGGLARVRVADNAEGPSLPDLLGDSGL